MVRKPNSGVGTSPSEEAAVATLAAGGETITAIAKAIDRSPAWVGNKRAKLAGKIEELRKEIFEDRVEDYTDIVTLALFRMRERLIEAPGKIQTKELVQIFKATFDKRQLLLSQPTSITADAEGSLDLNVLAVAEVFNENFERMQRALIERRVEPLLPDGGECVGGGVELEMGESAAGNKDQE